jgi:putative adenylate-forming enzyme
MLPQPSPVSMLAARSKFESLSVARHFLGARGRFRRGSRSELLAYQERAVERFLTTVVPRFPFYAKLGSRRFHELPIVDKATMMARFEAFNTRGIDRERALATALAAERTRDFRPTLDDVTVGLSSGTSGNRGIFLASAAERARYAGILLARALSDAHLRRIARPWSSPLRIALFLRSNSNLYATLASARVEFAYFDLERPLEAHLEALERRTPHVLAAPPNVLRAIAEAVLAGPRGIAPERVVSVADVLEPADAAAVRSAFGLPVHQLYQCTEGLLGYTCERGSLHLNETYVRVEAEWLDGARTRFIPVVTDFTRETQAIVRYRLDDVLRTAEPCACGRPERTIAAIEGRADDVLHLPREDGGAARVAIYPDFVRRAMAFAGDGVREYRVRYDGETLQVAIDAAGSGDATGVCERVAAELAALFRASGARSPATRFVAWRAEPPALKRRRIANAAPTT